MPGVLSVAVASDLIPPVQPFGDLGSADLFEILGKKPNTTAAGGGHSCQPAVFATLKIPVLQGRLWNQTENQRGDFVAVVNQAFATALLARWGRDRATNPRSFTQR